MRLRYVTEDGETWLEGDTDDVYAQAHAKARDDKHIHVDVYDENGDLEFSNPVGV